MKKKLQKKLVVDSSAPKDMSYTNHSHVSAFISLVDEESTMYATNSNAVSNYAELITHDDASYEIKWETQGNSVVMKNM